MGECIKRIRRREMRRREMEKEGENLRRRGDVERGED